MIGIAIPSIIGQIAKEVAMRREICSGSYKLLQPQKPGEDRKGFSERAAEYYHMPRYNGFKNPKYKKKECTHEHVSRGECMYCGKKGVE